MYVLGSPLGVCYILSLQVYVLGTLLSMQISFVGFQPVQSSEHMAVSGVVVTVGDHCVVHIIKPAWDHVWLVSGVQRVHTKNQDFLCGPLN